MPTEPQDSAGRREVLEQLLIKLSCVSDSWTRNAILQTVADYVDSEYQRGHEDGVRVTVERAIKALWEVPSVRAEDGGRYINLANRPEIEKAIRAIHLPEEEPEK